MKLTADQKLKVLAHVNTGERHALEFLWGIGDPFYAYVFQLFKIAQKEGLGTEYDKVKSIFPEHEQAYRDYLRGDIAKRIIKLIEEATTNAQHG